MLQSKYLSQPSIKLAFRSEFEFSKTHERILNLALPQIWHYMHELSESEYPYHHFEHALEVLVSAYKIAIAEGLSRRQALVAAVAGGFHDTGIAVQYCRNELIGAGFAVTFMVEHGFLRDEIHAVAKATMGTSPKERLSARSPIITQVVRDADMYSIGSVGFMSIQDSFRREVLQYPQYWGGIWEFAHQYEQGNQKPWWEFQIRFWSEHRFLSRGARKLFQAQKEKNMNHLRALAGQS